MNKISYLLRSPFSSLSPEDKEKVISLGRPTPDLQIKIEQKSAKVNRIRRFNRNIYKKNKWICGCDVSNALFCFPCVLFGGDYHWVKAGVVDLAHMCEKIKVHERSKRHNENVMTLAVLGGTEIQDELNSQADANRYIPVNEEIKAVAKRAAFEFCSVDLHPPEALKGKGLLNLIQMGINIGSSFGLVNANELIPHPTTISECLPQELGKIRAEDLPEIKLALKEEQLSLAVGIWTDKSEHHFITLTAHYIGASWNLENKTLFTSTFPQETPYSGKNIREQIEHKLEMLGLNIENFKKAHIVTDEEENISKALKDFKRSSCLACCLSAVLTYAFDPKYWILRVDMPEIIGVFNGCKTLVTFLKQSDQIQSLPRIVHQDCESQWILKISMLESILEQWDEIRDLLQKQGCLHKIKQINKSVLQDLVTFLKPFKEEIDKLREDKYPTVQFPLLMKERLKKHINTVHAKVENAEIMSKVEERASSYLKKKIVISKEQKIATFLTPSFRDMRMISAEERKKVIRDLRKTYGPFQHDISNSEESPSKRFKTMFDVYEEWCDESQTHQASDEIDIYINIRNSDCQDLLAFWKSQEQRLPQLCEVARRILCIPTTASFTERYCDTKGNTLDTYHDLSTESSDPIHIDSVTHSENSTVSSSNTAKMDIKIEIEEETLAEEITPTKIKFESEPPFISVSGLHDDLSSCITAKSLDSDTGKMDTKLGSREFDLEKVTAVIKSEHEIADADLVDGIEITYGEHNYAVMEAKAPAFSQVQL